MKVEINNTLKVKIEKNLLERVVKKFLESKKLNDKEVSVAIVGDKTISKLNKRYLHKNVATDVLAFTGEDNFLGEIIIDYEQTKRQAVIYNSSIKDELVFVLVHGLLHLIGYDDKTEKERREMEKLAEKFISSKMSPL